MPRSTSSSGSSRRRSNSRSSRSRSGSGSTPARRSPVQGGYRGGALNLAARLCGQARAGEILASREVTHLARRIDGVRYEDRGSLTFKGIADPVVVVRVVPEGEDPAERLPAVRAAGAAGAAETPPGGGSLSARSLLVLALVAISIPLLSSGDGAGVDIGTNSVARMNADDGSRRARRGARPAPRRERDRVREPVGRAARPRCRDPPRPRRRLGHRHDPRRERSGRHRGRRGIGLGDERRSTAPSSRINVETNEVSQTLPAGSAPNGIAVGDGVLWIADSIGGALLRVDPSSEETRVRAARRPAVGRGLHARRRVGLDRAEQRRADRP